jgi:hypothetical protein
MTHVALDFRHRAKRGIMSFTEAPPGSLPEPVFSAWVQHQLPTNQEWILGAPPQTVYVGVPTGREAEFLTPLDSEHSQYRLTLAYALWPGYSLDWIVHQVSLVQFPDAGTYTIFVIEGEYHES